MKNLLTFTFLILSLTIQAQFGIHTGPSISIYDAPQPYGGIKNATAGIDVGLYYTYHLSHVWSLQAEIDYLKLGARNPMEFPESFSTYHVHLPITVGYSIGDLTLSAGGYINRMIYARNYDISGLNTFGWSVRKWDYLKHVTYGWETAVQYNMHDVILSFKFMHGLTRVQDVNYGDHKELGKDEALIIGIYVPFNYFR
jgi:hypothetical protein